MSYSKKLLAPLVSAAITLIAVTNYWIVLTIGRRVASATDLMNAIWPVALPSSVAVLLVMSTLYHSLTSVVSELEKRRREAEDEATKDALTSLANRRAVQERLEQAMLRRDRTGESFAVLLLDLDHFKRVNDLLGHPVGDELLQEAASRLTKLVRATDTVARLGGDEFLILQANPAKLGDVRRLCSRVCEAMRMPYRIEGRELTLPASVGAVVAHDMLQQPSEYIRAADLALYAAKSNGRDCFHFFSRELDSQVKRRDILEGELRLALVSGSGLEVHFQPQVSAAGQIIAAECLFRWHHHQLGQIPAFEAVEVAEEAGLIDALGEYVFREAARFARARPTIAVAVNVSPTQFARNNQLADQLHRLALEEGVNPHQIELEVTEQLFLHDGMKCEEQIQKMRAYGFRLALDRFGTGYASLTHLRRFKVDKLKLDKAFATSAEVQDNIALIRAAVTLAHLFGLEVVAEGIETEVQEAVALESGCDALQGYRYSEPVPAAEFDQLLAKKCPQRNSTVR